jgi:hypothetical protein
MKIKSTVKRNIGLLPKHGTAAKQALVIGESTLELPDSDWVHLKDAAQDFLDAGVLVVVEAPESKLTVKEIKEKIQEESGVEVKGQKSKAELQKLAASLDVEV